MNALTWWMGCVDLMSFFWSQAVCIPGKPCSWVDTILSFSAFARWSWASLLWLCTAGPCTCLGNQCTDQKPLTTEAGLPWCLSRVVSGSYFCWVFIRTSVFERVMLSFFFLHWRINHSLFPYCHTHSWSEVIINANCKSLKCYNVFFCGSRRCLKSLYEEGSFA